MTDGVPQQSTAELSGVGMFIIRTASLNLMRSGTFSQCKCVSRGVMQSYLDAENTGRAAEFHTDCIRLVRCDGMPASAPLRYHSLTAAERGTKPVTEERSAEMSNKYSAIDAESQNRQLQSLRQTTSSTHQ